MNHNDQENSEFITSSTATDEVNSAHEGWLKSYRLRKGYSLDQMQESTRYAVRQIEALENKDWELLPKDSALRAMVRKYAQTVNLDVDKAMELLEKETGITPRKRFHPDNKVSSLDYKMHPIATDSDEGGGFAWSNFLLMLIILIITGLGVAIWQDAITLDDLNLGFVKDWFKKQ